MKHYEYIRYMTEEMMKLLSGHTKEKEKNYKDRKQEWFGIIPTGLKMFFFH